MLRHLLGVSIALFAGVPAANGFRGYDTIEWSVKGCHNVSDGVKSLEHHHASCWTRQDYYHRALTQFHFLGLFCWESGDMRMQLNCLRGQQLQEDQCRVKKTQCGVTRDKAIDAFSAFEVDCEGDLVTSFGLEEDDCGANSSKMVYTCCKHTRYTEPVERQTECVDASTSGLVAFERQRVTCPDGVIGGFRYEQGTCGAAQMQFTYTCMQRKALAPRPDGCLNPVDFGAVAGGRENEPANTEALQDVLDHAGCVVVPPGDYYAADLNIFSDTHLTLEAGARILSTHGVTMFALIYIPPGVENVVIDGAGEINGRAEDYVAYYDPEDTRLFPVPPDGQRPWLLYTEGVTNLVIRDIRAHNASQWTLHLRGSYNILIDNVDIYGDYRYPNNDGIDPDGCTGVTIVNTRIDVGDDGICLKAKGGWGALRDVYVKNCTIRSKSHAIKWGSPTDQDMYNIYFDDVRIYDSNAGIGIQQRSGGNIWNVTFANIWVETRYSAGGWWGNGAWLTVSSEPREGGGERGGWMRDITFVNITGRSENGGLVSARSDGKRVTNVVFENIHIELDAWSNYTTGVRCFDKEGNSIPCQGALDVRPSDIQDSSKCKVDSCPPGVTEFDDSVCEANSYNYCRTPLKGGMRGIHFINTDGATFDNVTFVWSDNPAFTPPYWGYQTCIGSDESSTNISDAGVTCVQRKPDVAWCDPSLTRNACADFGDETATCAEAGGEHRCVCTAGSDFSNPEKDGVTSHMCVGSAQETVQVAVKAVWEYVDCADGTILEQALRKLVTKLVGGSVQLIVQRCVPFTVVAVVDDVPKGIVGSVNLRTGAMDELANNASAYGDLAAFDAPTRAYFVVMTQECDAADPVRTVELNGDCVALSSVEGASARTTFATFFIVSLIFIMS
ncbi:hypothetical protein DIPPA_22217 [Diplonema papillatum]|nr:hypothetical protein DIPPA_22217 [Diplonema papillatum]